MKIHGMKKAITEMNADPYVSWSVFYHVPSGEVFAVEDDWCGFYQDDVAKIAKSQVLLAGYVPAAYTRERETWMDLKCRVCCLGVDDGNCDLVADAYKAGVPFEYILPQ